MVLTTNTRRTTRTTIVCVLILLDSIHNALLLFSEDASPFRIYGFASSPSSLIAFTVELLTILVSSDALYVHHRLLVLIL